MEKKLSVIVPIYNVENYLEKCINSIINQTYTNLEIILVDDGSKDACNIICDKISKQDKRIKVIHKENGGLISARYAGLLITESEYITFVDGDDWIKPNMYKEMMSHILNNDIDMVTSGIIRYWDDEDNTEYIDEVIEEGLYNRQMILERVIPRMLWCKEKNNWALDPSLCSKIFKKDILLKIYEKLNKETFYFGEDTSVMYPYILESKNIYFTHRCYYFHRQRARGVIASYIDKEDFFIDLFNVYTYLKNIFNNYPQKGVLIKQLDYFFIRWATVRKWKYNDTKGSSFSYLFPFDKVKRSSQVVIYGAGRVGQEYYEQVEKLKYCNIVLWIDKNYKNIHNYKVYDINKIFDVEYDYIVIANTSKDMKIAIKNKLMNIGIPESKIIN